MKALDWFSVQQITTFMLIFTRIGGVFLVSPLLSNRSVPNRVKVPLILMMSFLLFPFLVATKSVQFTNHIALLAAILEELTIGVVIGFSASLVFSSVLAAGELFGMQIGYSIATILDPSQEANAGVLTTLYIVLGALLFLYLEGHHVLLRALTKSFEILPLAKGFNLQFGFGLSELVQKMLIVAIQMSAPVLVVLTILNLIFGLLTKLSPQMNVYFNIGFIVGPIVGIGVLIVCMPLFRFLMLQMTEGLGPQLLKTIHELKGV